MDFGFDDRTPQELRASLLAFMDEHVYPAEPVFAEQLAGLADRWAWTHAAVLEELQGRGPRARACGTCSCRASTAPA